MFWRKTWSSAKIATSFRSLALPADERELIPTGSLPVPRPHPEQEREAIVSQVLTDFGLEVTAIVIGQRSRIVDKQDERWWFDTGRVAGIDLGRVKQLQATVTS